MFDMGNINGTIPFYTLFVKNLDIPFNQRPYEWSDDLIEGFLESLAEYVEDCFNDDDPYFFIGTIITCETAANTIEIVDGQQRILTLYMTSLMFDAIRRAPLHPDHDKRLRDNPEINSTWSTILEKFTSARIKFSNDLVNTDMQELFKQIKMDDHISAYKAKVEDPDNDIVLVKYRGNAGLTESRRVYKLYSELIKSDGVINRFFESLDKKEIEWKEAAGISGEIDNDTPRSDVLEYDKIRAKELIKFRDKFIENIQISELSTTQRETAWELFENFNAKRQALSSDSLIKNLVLFKSLNDPNYLALLAETWESVVKKLGTDDYVISMKDYIRFYWNSFRPHSTEKKIYKAFTNYIDEDPANANQFVDDLDETVDDYLWIASQKEMKKRINSPKEIEISSILFRLRLSNAKVFAPAALAIMGNRFLKGKPIRNDLLIEFLRLAEKTFFNVSVLGASPSTIEKYFAEFAYTLNGGPRTRQSQLDDRDQILGEITKLENKIKIYLKIQNRTEGDFKEGFKQGFSVNASKAALHYLNTLTMRNSLSPPPLQSKEIHLEHILPQTITKGGRVSANWNYYTELSHESSVNRIGNMILMKDVENQGLGNKSFGVKSDRYRNIATGGGTELGPLIEFFDANSITDKWTTDHIDKRSVEIFNQIYGYYKF